MKTKPVPAQPTRPLRIIHDEKILLQQQQPQKPQEATISENATTQSSNVSPPSQSIPPDTYASEETPKTSVIQADKPDNAVVTPQSVPTENPTPAQPPPKAFPVVEVNKPTPTQAAPSGRKVLIDAKNICKSFFVGKEETKVLKNLAVQIREEDFLVIVGPSGSGKSTFLHILLGLEIPTSGELNFLGKDLYKDTTEDIRSEFRKQHIGMVYQQPNWIKSMSVLENIAFPLILRGYRRELAHEIAYGALQEVHMEMHANQPPTELSGGQQQRVSLARCIVHNPEIVVADEPTGNLDYESGQEVMQLLQSLNVKDHKTVIMVTHDIEYIKFANCAVQIFDGQVAGYYGRENLGDLLTKLHAKHEDITNKQVPIETNAQKTI